MLGAAQNQRSPAFSRRWKHAFPVHRTVQCFIQRIRSLRTHSHCPPQRTRITSDIPRTGRYRPRSGSILYHPSRSCSHHRSRQGGEPGNPAVRQHSKHISNYRQRQFLPHNRQRNTGRSTYRCLHSCINGTTHDNPCRLFQHPDDIRIRIQSRRQDGYRPRRQL